MDIQNYTPNFAGGDYIVYFGRLVPGKGLFTLIKAMEQIKEISLYIIGEGPLHKELQSFVKNSRLNNIRFLGYLSGRPLKEIMGNALFTVVPSECYETFGFVIAESFALGKPVIGSRLGAIPELIEDGVNGLLFEPGDAKELAFKIKYLLKNPSLIIQMGKNARKKVEEKFNPQIHYLRLIEIYERVIDDYKRSHPRHN